MMRVGNRHGERVGGVGAGDLHAREQPSDHRMDLRLLGAAGADDGLFDQPRGIFADFDPRARRDHDHHAPRLAELERRLRIGVDEHLLDRGGVGLVLGEKLLELIAKRGEALWQGSGGVGLDLTVGEMAEMVALGADKAPTGGAEPRIETEDLQARRSSSSSGTS